MSGRRPAATWGPSTREGDAGYGGMTRGIAPTLLDQRVRPALTLAVVAVAMLLGGSAVPALVLVVELAALPLLVLVAALPPHPDRLARWAGWLCTAAAVAVAVQIVPLPQGWSRALPGRALATMLRGTAGIDGPFALSLDPQATLLSGLALIPGAAILLSALRASPAELARLVTLAVVIGCGSALLGVYQVATGGPYLFDDAQVGQATGLFANRNHQGALLLAALLLQAGLGTTWPRPRALLLAGPVVLVALAVVLTTSRAALLLLPFAVAVAIAALVARAPIAPWRAAGGVAVGVAGLALMTRLPVIAPVVARFANAGEDGRLGYWRDVGVAIQAFWPVGSGFGTFPAVYGSVEDLDGVGRSLVNHAHNEVLELLLEGGAAAAVLLLAWLLLVTAAARRLAASGARAGWTALAAVVAMGAVSLTEFPLRNFTDAAAFALAHAVLLTSSRR